MSPGHTESSEQGDYRRRRREISGWRSSLDLVSTVVVTGSLLVEVEWCVAAIVQGKGIERRRALAVRRVSVVERTTLALARRSANPLDVFISSSSSQFI